MKQWKGKRAVGENLRKRMPELTEDYFSAGAVALEPGKTWEEMHQFRLLTKRFRYTLEIFRPAYGRALEQRIELLRQVQSLLGDINDCVVTSAMLESLPHSEAVRSRLAAKAEKKTASLRVLWATEFGAAGKKAGWQRYLTQYACRTKTAPKNRQVPSVAKSATP